jgi:DNA ligase-1
MRFAELVEYLKKLEATSKRLEMIDILSKAFSESSTSEIPKMVYIFQETLLPSFYDVQLGVADKLVEKAISKAFDVAIDKVKRANSSMGDIGLTAENFDGNSARSKLDVVRVYDDLFAISKISGEGSIEMKVNRIAELLGAMSPLEARYTARFLLGQLRLGVGEATIMEALSLAKSGNRGFKSELERAYNMSSDLGRVAEVFYEKGEAGIKKFKIEVMNPIKSALAERLNSAEEILAKLGKCALDQKFDGFRAQVHKNGNNVKVFSRNQEDITHFMPEIIDAVKKLKQDKLIFDSEALTYDEDTNTLYPFQVTIQRKRKHNIEEVSGNFPLRLFVFDIMLLNNRELINEPYLKRRQVIDELFSASGTISKSKIIITDSKEEFNKFFDETVGEGLEGLFAKKLDAPYSAGARNFNWIKIKRSYKAQLSDTIDIVILGYFRGRGARADLGVGAVLGGVYDDREDMFKTLTKVGSGFSEEQFKQLKRLLDEIKLYKKPTRVDAILIPDVWVEPKYVITVKADEITKSPIHTCGREGGSGYALRFPRAVSFVRTDKRAEDSNSVKEIIEMFEEQKKVALKP